MKFQCIVIYPMFFIYIEFIKLFRQGFFRERNFLIIFLPASRIMNMRRHSEKIYLILYYICAKKVSPLYIVVPFRVHYCYSVENLLTYCIPKKSPSLLHIFISADQINLADLLTCFYDMKIMQLLVSSLLGFHVFYLVWFYNISLVPAIQVGQTSISKWN